MSCIVGLGGDVKPLVRKAHSGRSIIMIDGCPLQCGKHTLARHDLEAQLHWDLSKKRVRKSNHVDYEETDAARLEPELTAAIEHVSALAEPRIFSPSDTNSAPES